MHFRTAIALLTVLSTGSAALAQDYQRQPRQNQQQYNNQRQQQGQPGTDNERTACSGDAVKFCSDAIPYTFRVLACLQRNRTHISDACRYVLESHGQ